MTDEKRAIERPPAPDGSVYVQDVLDIVRRHAEKNDWCTTAEDVVNALFADFGSGIEVRFAERRYYCCRQCSNDRTRAEHEEYVKTADPRVFERFRLNDGRRDALVSKKALNTMLTALALNARAMSPITRAANALADIRLIFGIGEGAA